MIMPLPQFVDLVQRDATRFKDMVDKGLMRAR